VAQQPERSSIDLRAKANRHLRRAGIGMLGSFAVVAVGVLGEVAVKDLDQEWPPVLRDLGEGAPATAAASYLLLRRKTGEHIRAAIADRKAATALDRQPRSVLKLPPAVHMEAGAVPLPMPPEMPVFDTQLPDNQFGVSEVVIPQALIRSLDQQDK
jgi:hypothetical protein